MSADRPRAPALREPRRPSRVVASMLLAPPRFLAGLAGLAGLALSGAPAPQADPLDELVRSFAEQGIRLDPARGLVALDVAVGIRDDLLEYLLVGTNGAAHESLFVTDVRPSVLNAALLASGVERGANARWIERDPPPTSEEMLAGASPWIVLPPEGDGFFPYVAWREGEELFFYRVEDLLRNLETGRAMRRHRWVYIGSRMVKERRPGPDGEPREHFAADLEANHVSVVLFSQGNALVTAALPESLRQTIWLPNAWLLPPSKSRVLLCFARERLDVLPEELFAAVPALLAVEPEDADPPADPEEEDGR